MALDKKPPKKEREKAVLFGLIDLYIKTGRPIGSQTLQENGFSYISPATIRNYFAKWEKNGFLSQQHSSGGRVPTTQAFREYVNLVLQKPKKAKKEIEKIAEELKGYDKQIITLLEKSAEKLSEITGGAVFFLTPYFDQDFIQNIKLFALDKEKILVLLITDFGEIKTEMLYTSQNFCPGDLRYIEQFLLWKIGRGPLEKKNATLNKTAQRFYAELMLRQISSYSKKEPLYKTGLSKLIQYAEFNDPFQLTKMLALFEDQSQMEAILKESLKINRLSCWIAEELNMFGQDLPQICIAADTYKIGQTPVGAVAVLLPKRTRYSHLFGILTAFTEKLTKMLSSRVAKLKIPFTPGHLKKSVFEERSILLENKSKTKSY